MLISPFDQASDPPAIGAIGGEHAQGKQQSEHQGVTRATESAGRKRKQRGLTDGVKGNCEQRANHRHRERVTRSRRPAQKTAFHAHRLHDLPRCGLKRSAQVEKTE